MRVHEQGQTELTEPVSFDHEPPSEASQIGSIHIEVRQGIF